MALAPAPTLGSPQIDQLSPTQLLRTARLFASDTPRCRPWSKLMKKSHGGSNSTPAHTGTSGSSLGAGTHNGWHDHGESAGAFHVVRGTLLEQTSRRQRREFRTIIAGEGRSFQPDHIHHLANVRVGTALSVHVYPPRLTTTTRYAITPTGLQSTAADQVGLDW